MVALLEQMPALPVFNKHARAHALRIGPVLLEALAAWQAGRADASKRALRRFAVASGERAYLALPIQLSRFAALAFSDFLGARLVCPSTPELQRAVEQYLEPLVVSEGVKTPYHLGLSRDGTAEVLRWQSGAPYDWRNWRYRLDERMVQSGECPVYEYNAIRHGSIWYGTSTPVSVLLEWDNGAVYQP